MKTIIIILGLIAGNSGIGALISFTIQKLTGRNLNLVTKIFTGIFIIALLGIAIVFGWYILAPR